MGRKQSPLYADGCAFVSPVLNKIQTDSLKATLELFSAIANNVLLNYFACSCEYL